MDAFAPEQRKEGGGCKIGRVAKIPPMDKLSELSEEARRSGGTGGAINTFFCHHSRALQSFLLHALPRKKCTSYCAAGNPSLYVYACSFH